MQLSATRSAAADLAHLEGTLTGRLIRPHDSDYDAARALVYGGIDKRPAAIVRVADAADVASAVTWARDQGVELAVRSGGHGMAGFASVDGGVVIDVRDLRSLEIDPASRTAWAGTGLTARDVTVAAAEHGLAVGFGDTGSVGIGGITLGGGVGYLSRKHGLTIDSLLAAEIVTADGEVRLVDQRHDPDLFWAIRGGGGNFGVATRFLFALQPLDEFVGGMLLLPATPATVAGFIAASEAAPDELSAIANVMPLPPMPFVPEEQHGRLGIMALVAWAGDAAAGERAIAPLRALAEPIADMVRAMPYPDIYPPDNDDYHPTAVARTMFIERVDETVAETIVRFLDESDASMRVAQLRVLGGAIGRVAPDATAYAHRSSRIMVNVAAFYEGDADRLDRQAWVDRFSAALDQGDPGAYVNFLGDEGEERVRAAYSPATWSRLAAVKARYDPTNLFRLNQNVPPAPAGAAD